MRKCMKKAAICCMALGIAFGTISLKAEATEMPVVTLEGSIRTGTMGTNNGIQWSYDESTKTLTLTGKDSGLEVGGYYWPISPFANISEDIESIVFRDCTLEGSLHGLCGYMGELKSVDFINVDTSNVTSMSWMFCGCSSLTSLDISGFDTSNVNDMSYMFYGCSSLTSLDVSGFDTSNVTNMGSMFDGCSSLTSLDVSGFDTSNVTSMSHMFYGCSNLQSLDVSGFNTSNVTSMGDMFKGCSGLTSIDVSGFDTSKVIQIGHMFDGCSGLMSLDVSSFDTSNAAYMYDMFYGCSNLTNLDLSGFDMSNLKNYVKDMLWGCDKLTVIYTPKSLPTTHNIELPHVFYDSQKNEVREITAQHCNTVLTKSVDLSGLFATYDNCNFVKNGNDVRCYNTDGTPVINDFKCDGTYTYYFQADGTAMRDRLTYHPDGEHVIYFDEYGHEVFSNFANVKKTIEGKEVDDFCFFDVKGYLYVDVVTYDKEGKNLYYANPYGVMDRGKWFEFSETVKWADGTPFDKAGGKYGYANENGTLLTNTWTTDWQGRQCYLQGNGVALY